MKVLVNIDVPELAPAIEFYCAALGLQLNRIIDGDVAELTGGSCLIYLLEKPAGSRPARTLPAIRDYTRHWTPVHVDFAVDNLEEASKRAVAAGAKQESGCVQWMGSKCKVLRGTRFALPGGHFE